MHFAAECEWTNGEGLEAVGRVSQTARIALRHGSYQAQAQALLGCAGALFRSASSPLRGVSGWLGSKTTFRRY